MAFSSVSLLWNKWNIRGFVLLSLSLQVFLILFAPLRKKTANQRIIFLLWLAYLMADWVAAFTIGLISHNQGNSFAREVEVDGALQAFWASFLLLHLGGPDTITAFSLEDSSLWRRHLLSLIFQVGAAIYVFAQIFPSSKSLVIPTMLVFLVGVIKNAERTLALNLSSLPRLREWVLSQHKSFVRADNKEHRGFHLHEAWTLQQGEKDEATAHESAVVDHARYYFQIFKIFLGDLMFTRRERELSMHFFHSIRAMEALRLISVELQFIYEVLHTKALAIRSKWSYIFRFINFMNLMMAFVLFNRLKKHQLPKLDVEITYILLSGGIVLDVMALFMLIFSDWTVPKVLHNSRGSSILYSFLYRVVHAMDNLRKPRFTRCEAESNANVAYEALDTPLMFRRWSESISACNLLSTSLKESPKKMYKRDGSLSSIASSNLINFPFRMAGKITSYFHQAGETIARGCGLSSTKHEIAMITNTKYVSKNPFIKELWIFIFKEVISKTLNLPETKLMRELIMSNKSAGPRELIALWNQIELDNMIGLTKVIKIFEARGDLFLRSRTAGIDYGDLLEDVTRANYDDSIIMWHIATEIWYNKEKPQERNDERVFSKILSDYMMYLLFNHPNVMSAVAGISQITSGETLEELLLHVSNATKDVGGLCMQLFEDPSGLLRQAQRSKSVLRQGTDLARKMDKLEQKKWEVMSGVWVEMLTYAAIHIKGEAHVQVLSKGGELLAFVWLLMAHFGCVYKPELGMYYERWGHDVNHNVTVEGRPHTRNVFETQQIEKAPVTSSQTGSTSYGNAFSGDHSGSTS